MDLHQAYFVDGRNLESVSIQVSGTVAHRAGPGCWALVQGINRLVCASVFVFRPIR